MTIAKHKFFSVIALTLITFTVIIVNQHKKTMSVTADSIEKPLKAIGKQMNDQLTKSKLRNNRTSNSKLENRINSLDQKIALLGSQLNGLTSEALLPSMEKDETLEEPLTEEEMADQLKAEAERQINSFEELATQEGIDEKWATAAEEDVAGSFLALAESGIGMSKVQCHSSFCQAQISVDSTEPEAAIGKLQEASPWGGEVLIWIEDLEQGEGLVYLARDGYNLNLPDNREEM